MAQFFIGRPVFAIVIALVTALAGLLALRALPVEQYPQIAPPSVQLSARYPGASAQAVEDAVTQVVEKQMTGLDGLRYISASSGADGSMSMTLTFEAGTDADIAQVQVQNRLARATPLLPTEVQRQGVTASKARSDILLIVALTSDDEDVTSAELADALASDMEDALARVEGVGGTRLFGAPYAMRVWVDPYELANYGLSPQDVVSAIRTQNVQVTGGQIGAGPSLPGQALTATVTVRSLLETPEQFRAIPLRTTEGGAQVTVGDVARVEIGSGDYSTLRSYNGLPVSGMTINLATGANALETAEAVRARAEELVRFMPDSYDLVFPLDTTPFVQESIDEVVKTLFEAALFVFLIMFLFLQNVRATAIVMITVPVVLLGTLAILLALGFSINTLTMLAMVLGIGLLVDDAIVVIENVDRIMEEEGLGPKEATRKAMGEITSALVGIGVVLSAVFVPMAFFGGTAGVIYRQFAVTIVSVMGLSVVFAIVLTPALCATLLRPRKEGSAERGKGLAYRAKAPLRWFERGYERVAGAHAAGVRAVVRRAGRFAVVYLVLAGVTGFALTRLEGGFLPDEDQGIAFVQVTLPPGATLERTQAVLDDVSGYLRTEEANLVESVLAISGFSFAGSGQNAGLAFVSLKDWDERTGDGASAQALAQRVSIRFARLPEAQVFAITPPSVPGLGQSSGFDLYLQDRGGRGHQALVEAQMQLIGAANADPALTAVRPSGLLDVPQIDVDIDYNQALASGLDASAVNTTLSTALGGVYVNDYIDDGRIKRVYVSADAPYRGAPEDVLIWRVPGRDGALVPFSSFASVDWAFGSPLLQRYDGVPAVGVAGSAAPGVSSGRAIETVEALAGSQLPDGFDVAWTGLALEQLETGGQAPFLYGLSLLVVFLSLAALYESWSVPVSVMLIVPLGVLGSVGAVILAGLSNDIFLQVGLLAVIGLSAKNAILIVEFAKQIEEEQGQSPAKAAIEAAKLRLRPIVMTSLAFSLGVLPLALASGAGAAGRSAIGVSVLAGTLAASILGVFLTPLFYVLVRRVFGGRKERREHEPAPAEPSLAPAE